MFVGLSDKEPSPMLSVRLALEDFDSMPLSEMLWLTSYVWQFECVIVRRRGSTWTCAICTNYIQGRFHMQWWFTGTEQPEVARCSMLGVLFLTLDLFAYHHLALWLIDRGSGLHAGLLCATSVFISFLKKDFEYHLATGHVSDAFGCRGASFRIGLHKEACQPQWIALSQWWRSPNPYCRILFLSLHRSTVGLSSSHFSFYFSSVRVQWHCPKMPSHLCETQSRNSPVFEPRNGSLHQTSWQRFFSKCT